MTDEKTAEDYLALEATVMALREAPTKFREKEIGKHHRGEGTYDKGQFGFNKDDRFKAFSVYIHLDSYAGQWGRSSCYTLLHLPNQAVVAHALIQYLNRHIADVITEMAQTIEDESKEARDAYVTMLSEEIIRLHGDTEDHTETCDGHAHPPAISSSQPHSHTNRTIKIEGPAIS